MGAINFPKMGFTPDQIAALKKQGVIDDVAEQIEAVVKGNIKVDIAEPKKPKPRGKKK